MRLARLTASAALALTVLAVPLAVRPQPIPRIGYLCPFSCSGPRWSAFLESLEALGYVDGRSMTIVYPRDTRFARLEEAAAELVRRKVHIIFAAQDVQAARAAKQATPTIPIVMAVSGDPVALGLVASLARPGGNLTGITYLEDELVAEQMELLKEIIPTLSRIGALVDSANPAVPQRITQFETTARRLGLRLEAVQTRAPTTFEDAFAALGRGGPRGLVILSSPNHFFQRSRLAALAIQRHLAMATSAREFANARALLAYGPNLHEVSRRAAHFVDRILKGARPADLPVEQPTRFELVINRASRES